VTGEAMMAQGFERMRSRALSSLATARMFSEKKISLGSVCCR
jgi:hypothetical protein